MGGLAGGGAGDMAHAGTGAGMGRGGELGQANPLSGRKGLEGNAAAFEMKSLDKHLEPVRGPLLSPLSSCVSGAMAEQEMHAPQSPLSSTGEPQLTDREELETGLIRALIASYFNIVRLTIQDLVPKAIMRASPAPHLLSRYLDAPLTEGGTSPGADLLVNFSRESVQNRLVASLYKDSLFDELLHEDEALTAERTRIQNLLRAYREAFQVRGVAPLSLPLLLSAPRLTACACADAVRGAVDDPLTRKTSPTDLCTLSLPAAPLAVVLARSPADLTHARASFVSRWLSFLSLISCCCCNDCFTRSVSVAGSRPSELNRRGRGGERATRPSSGLARLAALFSRCE